MILLWTRQDGKIAVDERPTVLAAVKLADTLIASGVADAETVQVENLTRDGKSRVRSLKSARWEVVGSADWNEPEHEPELSDVGAVVEIKTPDGDEWAALREYAQAADAEVDVGKCEKFLGDRVRLSRDPDASKRRRRSSALA